MLEAWHPSAGSAQLDTPANRKVGNIDMIALWKSARCYCYNYYNYCRYHHHQTSRSPIVRSLIAYYDIINPLNSELNPICHLLALLGAHHIIHFSRIRVNLRQYVALCYCVAYMYLTCGDRQEDGPTSKLNFKSQLPWLSTNQTKFF